MNLEQRVKELEDAIRKHRDQKYDDRCWMDDLELYKVLGEEIPVGQNQLDSPCEMMANCVKFISSRHNPALEYRSPNREIERLENEIKELKLQLRHVYNRIAELKNYMKD